MSYPKTKLLKKLLQLTSPSVSILISFFFLFTACDERANFKELLIGEFRLIDSDSSILNLWPHGMFTTENRINGVYYGDGSWDAVNDHYIILTLDFENGESLLLKYSPKDSSLVGINENAENIRLRKVKSINYE